MSWPISRVLSWTIIHLGRTSPSPQATYPEAARATPMLPYLVLLQVGFTMPPRVTTDAVRSYRTLSPLPAPNARGGLLSVALAVGSRLPGVTWHPALWSPDFPPAVHGKPSRPAIAWPTQATNLGDVGRISSPGRFDSTVFWQSACCRCQPRGLTG